MKKIQLIAAFLFTGWIMHGQITYVNLIAQGNNDGSSWEDAYNSLQDALENTLEGEIWVAEGTYQPVKPSNLGDYSFRISNNVSLFGGFSISNNPRWEDRNWEDYPTVLSGDLINIDGIIYIRVQDTQFDISIDGFTIKNGNNDFAAAQIITPNTTNRNNFVTFRNCNFSENDGKGISSSHVSLKIEKCTFRNNKSTSCGAAVDCSARSEDNNFLIILNSTFEGNISEYGGGAVCLDGNGIMVGCLFVDNYGENFGNHIYNFLDGDSLIISNCTFVEKVIRNSNSTILSATFDSSYIEIKNSIFFNHNGYLSSNVLDFIGGNTTVKLEHSFLSKKECPIDIICGEGMIFDMNSPFIGETNFRPSNDAPVVNAGKYEYPSNLMNSDIDNNPRISGGKIDMGAYEVTSIARECPTVEDNFEIGTFDPITWRPFPNLSGENGIIEIKDGDGVNNSKGVRMGKSTDAGGFTTNILDLRLDLSCHENAELSFSIADNYDGNDDVDGIYLSNDFEFFHKVLSFQPEEWCNNRLSQHPPLDIDELAASVGLSLNETFTIRFMQRGEDDFGGSSETSEDGYFIDNIKVYDPELVYARLPIEDNFETGIFEPYWAWNFADKTASIASNDPITSPINIVEIREGVGVDNSRGIIMGRECDGAFSVNALDLHLNLSGETNVALSFMIADNYDNTDADDGIYFSDDGGINFQKVINFQPEEWCNNRFSQYPTLDVDKLAAVAGLNLTSQFVIRFQQRGEDDFGGSSETSEDGLFLDNIKVYDPGLTYAKLPFIDGFETSRLEPWWAWNTAELTSSVPSNFAITSPINIVEVQDLGIFNGTYGLTMGRICDDFFTVNALDLHLNLAEESNVEMTFLIADNYDNTDEDDGIYFSDNGGKSFTKVVDFFPEEWCNNRLSQHPPLDIDRLAKKVGLRLTNEFVVRFQQRGENDFGGSSENSEDGFYIDDVKVYDPELEYANLPFEDDFELGQFKKAWAWNFADATAKVPSNFSITSPISIIEVQENKGRNNTYGVVAGRECDDVFTVNALDLHLNLSGANNANLTFWIADNYDNTDADDGIYFSNDGGETFQKVYDFDFSSTANNRFEEYQLPIGNLALENGIALTSKFVIRFQQRGEDDFGGSSESSEDGFFLDDVSVSGMTTSNSHVQLDHSIEIYPNPTNTTINIRIEKSNGAIKFLTIKDVSGKTYFLKDYNDNKKIQIDISSLPKGLYFLSIMFENEEIFNEKFVKQ